MMNGFEYSDDNKRYHSYSYYLKKRFGKKVYKVPLNIDLGCPNRDGTKGFGGCAFCSAKMSGNFAGDPRRSVEEQYAQVRGVMEKKWADALCIPYFQAGSNTYADVGILREMFGAALELENAVGLSIATRADCIDSEKAKMLGELAKDTYLTVELGLQTIYDSTALVMNRCHTYADLLRAYELLRAENVNVCIHLINGLPGETADMMRESAQTVGQLDIHAVKLHLLHVLKGTVLADMYTRGEFRTLERDEYIGIICDQLELLPPQIVIERLTGDGDRNELIAPLWSRDKRRVLNGIDMEMSRRNAYQGDKL
ncbi:MAG: TIGR01212 family radical SAM protein [Ruminococcus sp.]|uniref:TIGR01212 family radical SAM protein n=1 Tax=Ruminococcus sp. TaxID=41978 RepID=UPI0025FA6DCE|nr:TIGR01212 family radical SAM protein [Ruminococcus sp.]MBO4866244.1 TIGR01212 family radical SAM protein [Ruminococcus sp.]